MAGILDNHILKINLATGGIVKEPIAEDVRRRFIGARGLNDWLLYREVEPGKTDPLSPGNVLVFGAGLLGGTGMPASGRLTITSLNALNGGYGESNSSGYFASELRAAGYDHIVIEGRSNTPVYLWIDDSRVELRDAAELVGKTTFETQEAIKEALGNPNAKICAIGPAGERLVRYALVNVTNRYCGRCGMGAIMGSKNLKAIAVCGSGSLETVAPDGFKEYVRKVDRALRESENLNYIRETGMAGSPEGYDSLQGIRNFQGVSFDRISDIGYEAVKKYYKKVLPCLDCPVDCDRLIEIPEGEPYGPTSVSSMEATPAYNFAHFLIDDIRTVIKGFHLCNAYGIDIHSWSGVTQWAIECYERGILTREETDKLDLRWGDGPLLLELIRRTAYREGNLGNLLADGVALASQRVGRGSEKYGMLIKNMEVDDDLRVNKGWSLGVMTELRGPGHIFGAFYAEVEAGDMAEEEAKRLYGTENAVKPRVYDDKAELVAKTERMAAVEDSLGFCNFTTQHGNPQWMREFDIEYGSLEVDADIIRVATGWDMDEQELLQTAERILSLEKGINALAGLGRKDDYPPERFYEPIPSGPYQGLSLDKQKVTEMLRDHDVLHGWDPETGIPRRETLEALGLEGMAEELEKLYQTD